MYCIKYLNIFNTYKYVKYMTIIRKYFIANDNNWTSKGNLYVSTLSRCITMYTHSRKVVYYSSYLENNLSNNTDKSNVNYNDKSEEESFTTKNFISPTIEYRENSNFANIKPKLIVKKTRLSIVIVNRNSCD